MDLLGEVQTVTTESFGTCDDYSSPLAGSVPPARRCRGCQNAQPALLLQGSKTVAPQQATTDPVWPRSRSCPNPDTSDKLSMEGKWRQTGPLTPPIESPAQRGLATSGTLQGNRPLQSVTATPETRAALRGPKETVARAGARSCWAPG